MEGSAYTAPSTTAHMKNVRVMNLHAANEVLVTWGPGKGVVMHHVCGRVRLLANESATDDGGPIIPSGWGLIVNAVGTDPNVQASASGLEL
jgi:hypothetical protein